MRRIFISYSRSDEQYVARLAGQLRDAGLDVWYDHQLGSGERWERVIEREIEACDAMVVVMSPNSAESVMVTNEIDLARARRKALAPLLLAGDTFFGLRHLNYEEVTGGRLPSRGFVERLLALPTHDDPAGRGDDRPASSTGRPQRQLPRRRTGWLFAAVLGVLTAAVGGLWTLQGLDVLGGSSMSGRSMWAIIGPILAVSGLLIVLFGLRRRRPRD